MNKILTVALLLFISMLAFAEEQSVEKPKIVYVYSIITWYDRAKPFTNEFLHQSEWSCMDMRARINAILTRYDDDPLFGWIGECTERVS